MNFKNLQGSKAFRLFFVSAALLSALASFSQSSSIAVAPNKMNVLYIGVDNPVSVAASNGSDERVTVSISGAEGSVSKIGTGLYNVRVTSLSDECLMKVYVDQKLTGTSGFRVRNLPVPVGTIGGFSSGDNVSADKFQLQKGVGVYIKDFPFDVKYEVLDFTLTVDDEKGDVRSAQCKGALFSSETRQYIEQHIKSGRTVTIDKLRVKDPGGRELKLPSLVYYIK